MTESARRPTGSSGKAGPRTEREPESAAFETARIGPRRGRQPVIVLGFVAFLASVVGIGIGGRTAPVPSDAPPPVAVAFPSQAAAPPTEAAPTPAVVVTAYVDAGRQIGSLRRPVIIGAAVRASSSVPVRVDMGDGGSRGSARA